MSTLSPTFRRWMSPPPIYNAAVDPRDGTRLTPYLTLPYILSLTWLTYPVVSLLFVAFRLHISSASAQDAVAGAKSELTASCSAAERAATSVASLPRFMALATNRQIADAVNGTMNAARATLNIALTILEAIVNFVIDTYRSTFLCFLELIVRGTLAVLIGAVQEINSFLQSTFSTIRTSIQNDVSSVNSAIQSAVDGINKINPFNKITAPQLSVPSLNSLSNVTLPSSFQDSLTKLNASLPSLDQLKKAITDVIDTPFEDLKVSINQTFAGLNFNESVLPIPQQDTVSFCGDLDTSALDNLGRDLVKLTKIGIVILVVLAILLIGAHCVLEWYKWQCLQRHLRFTREAWITDPTMNNAVNDGEVPTLRMTNHNLLMLAANQHHPLLMFIAHRLSRLLKLTPSQFTNLRWFFHYIFHPPVLVCFLIGFFGLLSVELQLLAIKPLEAKFTQEVNATVADFSNKIAASVNASMFNHSAAYAQTINNQIDLTQSTVNDGLFGWVNGTTTFLNNTISTFYQDVQNAVNSVFNGTVLDQPMQDFVACILGSKIEALETAFTFLHDNLHIDIPTVNQSVLVLSQAHVNEAVQPISTAAIGDGTGNSQGVVGKLIARYVASLKEERIMFAVLLGCWCLVVVIALLIILWHSCIRPRVEKQRQRKFSKEHRTFNMVIPYAVSSYPADNSSKEKSPVVASKTPAHDGFFTIDLHARGDRQPGETQGGNQQIRANNSWDSLLDSNANMDNSPRAAMKKKISSPRKLMAVGRKAGYEHFVTDEERVRIQAAEAATEDGAQENGWLKKLTAALHKKNVGEGDGERSGFSGGNSSKEDRRARARPNLTIVTTNSAFTNISRDQLPTAGDNVTSQTAQYENNLVSAWSTSSGQPPLTPWATSPLNVKKKKRARSQSSMTDRSPASQSRRLSKSHKRRNSHVLQGLIPDMPPLPPAAVSTSPQAMTPFSTYGGPAFYDPEYHAQRDIPLPDNRTMVMQHRRRSSVPLQKFTSNVHPVPIPRRGSRLYVAEFAKHDSVQTNSSPLSNPFQSPIEDARKSRMRSPTDPFSSPFDYNVTTGPKDTPVPNANPFFPIAF